MHCKYKGYTPTDVKRKKNRTGQLQPGMRASVSESRHIRRSTKPLSPFNHRLPSMPVERITWTQRTRMPKGVPLSLQKPRLPHQSPVKSTQTTPPKNWLDKKKRKWLPSTRGTGTALGTRPRPVRLPCRPTRASKVLSNWQQMTSHCRMLRFWRLAVDVPAKSTKSPAVEASMDGLAG